MKTIGVIGAMEEEISFLKEEMAIVTNKTAVGLQFYIGHYGDKNVVLVRSGIGKVNAAICAQVLIDLFGVDYIINTGVAGGIAAGLKIGDMIISKDAIYHDMDTSVFGDPVGVIPRMAESIFAADEEMIQIAKQAAEEMQWNERVMVGRIASGDQFVASAELKKQIRHNVQADCAEMEGAAIAHTCYLNRIPFVMIRSISDLSEEGGETSYETFAVEQARRCCYLVSRIIERM